MAAIWTFLAGGNVAMTVACSATRSASSPISIPRMWATAWANREALSFPTMSNGAGHFGRREQGCKRL